jgi:hypothetical protein
MGKAKHMRMEVIHGSQIIPKADQQALLIGVSARMNARALLRRKERAIKRHEGFPERQSVAIAKLAVEEQIVKAMWTIARQPLGQAAPIAAARCGIEYFHDRSDVHARYADAAGGKWDTAAPKPSLPSARDITQADRVQDWLLFIEDEDLRKLLVVGATSKRGDAGRQISWRRIMLSMKELNGVSMTRLNARYQEALRIIVSALTIASAGNLGYLLR